MTIGINTPQELEAKPGIIAVFEAHGSDIGPMLSGANGSELRKAWRPAVAAALELHVQTTYAPVLASIGDNQQIRVLGDDAHNHAIIVVCTSDTPFGKSLPRTMRRLLKRMRDDKRAKEVAA